MNQRIIRIIAGFCLLFLISGQVSGAVFLKNGSEVNETYPLPSIMSYGNDTGEGAVLFYNTHCGACHDVLDFLKNFTPEHPDLSIKTYDLYNNSDNRELFETYKTAYNRSKIYVPVVFIHDVGLEGSKIIIPYLPPLLENITAKY